MPKPVFESPRPVSQSGLWDLLFDFYRSDLSEAKET